MSEVKTQRKRRPASGRGAPGRRRVPREVRELEMVEVASRVFARRGYGDTSMEEVAEAAGVTKPMLYAYFGSKEGLFTACQRAASDHLQREVRAAAATTDITPDERMFRGLMAVFDFVEEHRESWRLCFHPEGGGPHGAIGAGAAHAQQAMSETLAEILVTTAQAQGIAPDAAGHDAAQAYALTGATIGATAWWLDHPEEPKELQVLRLMNLVWIGFGGMLEGRLWVPPF